MALKALRVTRVTKAARGNQEHKETLDYKEGLEMRGGCAP